MAASSSPIVNDKDVCVCSGDNAVRFDDNGLPVWCCACNKKIDMSSAYEMQAGLAKYRGFTKATVDDLDELRKDIHKYVDTLSGASDDKIKHVSRELTSIYSQLDLLNKTVNRAPRLQGTSYVELGITFFTCCCGVMTLAGAYTFARS